MVRWVVSLECLGVPARATLLKAMQARLGLATIPDNNNERRQCPFALLLHRLRCLARVGPTHDVLLQGSWLLGVPCDELRKTLFRQLGHALVAKLLLPAAGGGAATAHLMVYLKASAHEAFEAQLDSKEVTLQHLSALEPLLLEHAAADSPFPVRIVGFQCPEFTNDNPVALNKLVDLVCDACKQVMDCQGVTAAV